MSRLCASLIAVFLCGALVTAPASAAYAAGCSPRTKEANLDHTPWGQERMNPERVWPLSRGEGVKVAVIDSGVSDAHPVLKDKVKYGKDHVVPEEGESKVGADCDLVGHGTSIAGIIAGREDSDSPFAGMAPDAKLMAIRILPDMGVSGNRDLPDIVATSIREAVDAGADVINLSVQIVHSQKLQDAVEYAAKKNVVMVAAAGNQGGKDGTNEPQYPAAYDSDALLAVSSMGQEGAKTESSNVGEYVDLAAPGEQIAGPGPEGKGFTGGEEATGTSFAAAFVSGSAALTRARFPDSDAAGIADRMRATAQSPPHLRDEQVGFGAVDPYRAVTADLGRTESDTAAHGPGMELDGDHQAQPRVLATVLLGVSVAVAIAVWCAKWVFPPVLRKRRERRAQRRRLRRA